MWDTAFMMLFGIYGRRAFPFIHSLNNFYTKQHDDGFICRQISTKDGGDSFQPFDPNATGPNILAWAEWSHFRATANKERLADIFWGLLAFHNWMKAHRSWQNRLYWGTGLASGMNNQTRIPDSLTHHKHWSWIDTSLQAALNCYRLEQMAEVLGESQMATDLTSERLHLMQKINSKMWDDELSFYVDRSRDGESSGMMTIGAYWALHLPDFVPANKLTNFIAHLRSKKAFNRPHRIPAQPANSTGYDPAGNQWCSGVWSPTNYMTLQGLTRVGHFDLTHEIALNHLTNLAEIFSHTDTLWEYYAPEEASPGDSAQPNFVGWTGLSPITILLEHVIGIQADWLLRRVTWHRKLNSTAPYGGVAFPIWHGGLARFGRR